MKFISNLYKQIKQNIKKLLDWISFITKNYQKSIPIYTKHNTSGLKIHLGSGNINIQGWLNIDSRDFHHIHLISENLNLHKFNDESISSVYLSHVLEHFSFDDAELLLKKIYNKLDFDGSIIISVPNFESISSIYAKSKNLELIKYAVMGGQDYEHNFHKSVYDYTDLKNLLLKCGFKNVENWNTVNEFGHSLNDWSDRTYKVNGKKIPISLNLKAFKL